MKTEHFLRVRLLLAFQFLLEGAIGVLTIIWVLTCIVFFFLPFSQQLMHWLTTADWLTRDLLWALAPPKCEATAYIAMGWEGMDRCRPDEMHFTDMKGLNLFLNFVAEIHVSILWVIANAIALFPLVELGLWLDDRQSAWMEEIDSLELKFGKVPETVLPKILTIVWRYFFWAVVGVPIFIIIVALIYIWIRDGLL